MDIRRREFLRFATTSFVASGSAISALAGAWAFAEEPDGRALFDVKSFGAAADGKTIDTPAVNRAIAAAAATGGGTVRFPRAPTPAIQSISRVMSRCILSWAPSFWRPRAMASTPLNPMHHSKATRTSAITIGTTA